MEFNDFTICITGTLNNEAWNQYSEIIPINHIISDNIAIFSSYSKIYKDESNILTVNIFHAIESLPV